MQMLGSWGFDVALLQEAFLPETSWERHHYDRSATIANFSKRVELEELTSIPPGRRSERDEFTKSAPGPLAAAHVIPTVDAPFFVVSQLYAR